MTNLKFADWVFDALKPEVRSLMSRSIKFEIRSLKSLFGPFTDSGFYNSVFYRFRLLQFRVLHIPAFTIPCFTDSGFYNSVFYRFRLLQFRVLQIPAFTIPCFHIPHSIPHSIPWFLIPGFTDSHREILKEALAVVFGTGHFRVYH